MWSLVPHGLEPFHEAPLDSISTSSLSIMQSGCGDAFLDSQAWLTNVVHKQTRSSKGHGLESWRRIHNCCNPRNAGAAEAIRAQLVRERPSTSALGLQNALAEFGNLVVEYEVVATRALGEDVLVMSLRAVIPTGLLLRPGMFYETPSSRFSLGGRVWHANNS